MGSEMCIRDRFTTEKLQQLTSLLEEFIALGVPAGRGDEEE